MQADELHVIRPVLYNVVEKPEAGFWVGGPWKQQLYNIILYRRKGNNLLILKLICDSKEYTK